MKLDENTRAFLHKSHIPQHAVEFEDDEDLKKEEKKALKQMDKIKGKKKKKTESGEITAGSVLPKVVVKEINYFDSIPMVSMREDLLQTTALTYAALRPGQTVQAEVETVDEVAKKLVLRLNKFVRGVLPIEHISDNPLKVLPPKYAKEGKKITVRVFSVRNHGRKADDLAFTKKDSLMKESVEIFD